MNQRGQKSAAAVRLVPAVQRVNRPEAPPELTQDQAAIWVAVTNSKPADWFGPETLPLLAAYCRGCVEHQRVSALIDSFNTECLTLEDASDLKRYETLIRLQDRLSQQMARLGTKMRLTQQSQYGARGAARESAKAGKARPWQYEGGS